MVELYRKIRYYILRAFNRWVLGNCLDQNCGMYLWYYRVESALPEGLRYSVRDVDTALYSRNLVAQLRPYIISRQGGDMESFTLDGWSKRERSP